MNTLISILGGVVAGLIIGFFLWRDGKKTGSLMSECCTSDSRMTGGSDLISEKEAEKAANLEKVKALILNQTKITNEEVQDLLSVSSATAERYLDEIESAGIIRQVGKTGVKTYYEKN